jgi:hypothetical protein
MNKILLREMIDDLEDAQKHSAGETKHLIANTKHHLIVYLNELE